MDAVETREQLQSGVLKPGTHIVVTQQIPARDRTWTTIVRGVIISYDQRSTGSWYAHAHGDKLWLDRLIIRKDDGEIVTLNLDEYSNVEVDQAAASAQA